MAVTIIKKKSDLRIYKFGPVNEGAGDMKDVLGGKGAGLAEMVSMGIPVPPGFTLPCSASIRYQKVNDKDAYLNEVMQHVRKGMQYLDDVFGYLPLVSVRSGARVSMPGMMDTILNVGITSESIEVWVKRIGERAAYDSYRRLIEMYGSVAMDVAGFDVLLNAAKKDEGVSADSELSVGALKALCRRYKTLIRESTGGEFPDELDAQLRGAVEAVFRSWDNDRAKEYRKHYSIPEDWGTAVNVQAMVFGNMDDQSCSGVAFSRDKATGEAKVTGEFLVNAQGEDVVAGVRTPQPIAEMAGFNKEALLHLGGLIALLQDKARDMVEVEFTVQSGKLYILQYRVGKRTAQAAFKIAHDMAEEGLITKDEALSRVSFDDALSALTDKIDPSFKGKPIVTGIAGGGGVVSGVAVFDTADAVICNEPCILVRKETDPDDFAGIAKAVGVLTSTGGVTSHAAVVAAGMDKACVVGTTGMVVTSSQATIVAAVKSFKKGDVISIDGSTGNVYLGKVPVVTGHASKELVELAAWAAEGKDVAERLAFSPDMSVFEMQTVLQNCRSKSVQLDIASVKPGNLAPLGKMLEAIGVKFERIIIDTKNLRQYQPLIDGMFDAVFGALPVKPTGVFPDVLGWPDAVKAKSYVKAYTTFAQNEYLEKGFKLYSVVSTFGDLLKSDGAIDVSDEVIDKVFGGIEAFEAAKALLKGQKGVNLYTPKALYWHEFLKEH